MMTTNETNNGLMYELDAKNEFLITINERTRKSYERIFIITKPYEEKHKKDLNKFTLNEIEEILFDLEANNRNTVESYARIMSSYLNWCVANNKSNKNPLSDLKPSDFEKYLSNEEIYFTEKQLRRWEDNCANFQDSVIIRLLFIGVGGKLMSEIRNLKKQDIDFTNKRIKLINTLKADEKSGLPIKFTERWMDVDQHTLDLIEGAIEKKIYAKKNGEMAPIENVRPYTDLVQNDYVVRASITKNENFNKPVDKFVIYRRIHTLSESYGVEELSAKFIQRSGMIYEASKLIKDEKLSLDDLKMVADKFNVKSYHNLKGFLTVDNIRRTYNK